MFFLLGALSLLIFTFFFIPKGYPLHEILHLPIYWWKVSRIPIYGLAPERVQYGSHSKQYYWVFPPQAGKGKSHKIFIYFHGGAWRFGRPEMFKLVAFTLVKLGYTVVLPSCRRTPKYNYTSIREDLTQILLSIDHRFFQADTTYILGGMSSGGNLAAHLFYNKAILQQHGFDRNRLRALLLLGAPLDLRQMPQNKLVCSFASTMGSAVFKEANVQNHLDQVEDRRVLIIHGQSDGLVPFKSAHSFISILRERQESKIQIHAPIDATHLDVAAWACGENEFKSIILSWLQAI